MIIANGTVVTAEASFSADVRIEGEKIIEIGRGLAAYNSDELVIDATDTLVMPGGVDVHTHMEMSLGSVRASDDFLTGTIAAACGGTTTIIDHMSFGPPGCSLTQQIETYHQLAKDRAVIDYGFHGVVSHVDDTILDELAQLADEGITSLKFYMTYDNRLNDREIVRLLMRTKELGLLCCVHCEDHEMLTALRERFVAEGKTSPEYHALSRPDTCEASAINRVTKLAHEAGDAPLYIVHTSSAAGLSAARTRYKINVILETCPQYLILNDSFYALQGKDALEGLKYIISPPLRKKTDQDALWRAIGDGRIKTIGTDHCPFFFATDKQLGSNDFTKCPNGIPGVELRLAQMYSEGVVKRGLSAQRIVELCSAAPARCFGIYPQKGTIAVGSDADIVIFDPEIKLTVFQEMLHENVDYTPYEGMYLKGYPFMTISRGEIIAYNGDFVGELGRGRFLKRGPSDVFR